MRVKLRAAIQKRAEEEQAEGRVFSLEQMFKTFDFNGDGVFDQQEFEAAFTVMEIPFKKAELRELIDMADTNKDGSVDFTEFKTYVYETDLADEAKLEMVDSD